jgi:hypothetical protein
MVDSDLVFVAAYPIAPHPQGGGGRAEIAFETCVLESADHAAMAFTSIQRLIEALGPMQPWIAVPLGRVRNLLGAAGLSQIAVDPTLPADARRWRQDDVRRLVEGQGH